MPSMPGRYRRTGRAQLSSTLRPLQSGHDQVASVSRAGAATSFSCACRRPSRRRAALPPLFLSGKNLRRCGLWTSAGFPAECHAERNMYSHRETGEAFWRLIPIRHYGTTERTIAPAGAIVPSPGAIVQRKFVVRHGTVYEIVDPTPTRRPAVLWPYRVLPCGVPNCMLAEPRPRTRA